MQNVKNADADMRRFRTISTLNIALITKKLRLSFLFNFYLVLNCQKCIFSLRYLDEKEKKLQEALKQIQILERDIAEKDSEVINYFPTLQNCSQNP